MPTPQDLPRVPGGGRMFYGWWLALAGAIIGTLQGLFIGFGFSAFFLPIQEELETSRAGLSIAFSLSQLEAGLTGPVNGYLIDRFGPRRIMTIGFIILGAGWVVLGLVQSLYAFYGAYVMLALGSSLCGYLPVSSTISRWFARRRAIAIGLAQSGDGLGGLLVPLLALAITAFGWRAAATGIGPVFLILGPLLASLFRPRPEEFGLRPDGDAPAARPKPAEGLAAAPAAVAEPGGETSFSPRQALKTPAFWLIATAHSLTLLMVSGINVHQIPALVNAGLSYGTAASVLAVTTAATTVGRLLFGFLGDRFNRQYALAGCFFLQAIAVMILAQAHSLGMALAFAVLYGFSFGGRGPLLVSIRGDFFGTGSFATILGMSQTVLMAGTIVGPVFAGWVFDVRGSYAFAFTVMAVINVLAMAVLLAARKPTLKAKPVVVPLSGEALH